jgi:hypothetical protein
MMRRFGLFSLVLALYLGLAGCGEKQPTIKGPLDPRLQVTPASGAQSPQKPAPKIPESKTATAKPQ